MGDLPLCGWLRKLRDEHGVPLRVVAAAVNIDSTLLSKLEVGDRLPTDAQADALRQYYGVTTEEMRRRLVAARILHEYGKDPVLPDALTMVREEVGPVPGSGRRKKPPTHKNRRPKPQ